MHVAWPDARDASGLKDVYYRRSTDGGASFGAEIQIDSSGPGRGQRARRPAAGGEGLHDRRGLLGEAAAGGRGGPGEGGRVHRRRRELPGGPDGGRLRGRDHRGHRRGTPPSAAGRCSSPGRTTAPRARPRCSRCAPSIRGANWSSDTQVSGADGIRSDEGDLRLRREGRDRAAVPGLRLGRLDRVGFLDRRAARAGARRSGSRSWTGCCRARREPSTRLYRNVIATWTRISFVSGFAVDTIASGYRPADPGRRGLHGGSRFGAARPEPLRSRRAGAGGFLDGSGRLRAPGRRPQHRHGLRRAADAHPGHQRFPDPPGCEREAARRRSPPPSACRWAAIRSPRWASTR